MTQPPPLCIAALFCETSRIRDGKLDLLGLYDEKRFDYPAQADLNIYLKLVNGRGHVDLQIAIPGTAPGELGRVPANLFETTASVHFKSPIDPAECVFNLRNVPLPKPGEYWFAISSAGHPIASMRLRAV